LEVDIQYFFRSIYSRLVIEDEFTLALQKLNEFFRHIFILNGLFCLGEITFASHIDWSPLGSFLRLTTSDFKLFCSLTKKGDLIKKETMFRSVPSSWATQNW
jgi:hypothetical protein